MFSLTESCPMCAATIHQEVWQFDRDKRIYLHCGNCLLVYVPKEFHLSFDDATKRYQNHEPDAGSKGHVNHLNLAILPTLPFLKKQTKGLDYGCGPKPILSQLLKKFDFDVENFDLSFYPIMKSRNYDFIFCIETAEHFIHPEKDFYQILNLLNPNSIFTLMTERYIDKSHFSNWYYKRDLTHVSFYNQETLDYIAEKFRLKLLYDDGSKVCVFGS